ncbi:MAG: hypothetical protein GY714_18125 [Desulfobacterales bacterium]|nr:hypothetical protein [Desulfobacterales bacterium]
MATEALQIDALWAGLNDPDTGQSYSGAIVGFFEAGTTTPKAVWLDKEKTLPTTAGLAQTTLSSNGIAKVFGSGSYKINIYAPTDTGLTTPLSGSIDGATYLSPYSDSYDTIADLKASTISYDIGTKINVYGYYTKGDVGLRVYEVVATGTGTDDGGTYITSTDTLRQYHLIDYNVWSFELFGAKGNGSDSDVTAFNAAIAASISYSESTIFGTFGKTYNLDVIVSIIQSDLGIDFRGATVIGVALCLQWNGVAGYTDKSGVWTGVPTGNFVRNGKFYNTELPYAQYQRGFVMENMSQTGVSNTALTVSCCQDSTFRNIDIAGGQAEGGQFAALFLHSNNTVVENVYMHDYAYYYAMQFKGGRDNIAMNCNSVNVKAPVADPGKTAFMVAYYTRGDSPGGPSGTGSVLSKYPYLSTSSDPWTDPDDQRATLNTKYINCNAYNSNGIGYDCIESQGVSITRCSIFDTNGGILLRTKGNVPTTPEHPVSTNWGKEKDFLVDDVRMKNLGTLAYPGRGIRVQNDTYNYGQALPPLIPYNPFTGIVIKNVQMENISLDGISIVATQGAKVTNCRIENCNTVGYSTNNYSGLVSRQNDGIYIDNVTSVDTQSTPTTYYTMVSSNTMPATDGTNRPTNITNCYNKGGTNAYGFALWAGENYFGNTPADAITTTTVAADTNEDVRLEVLSSTERAVTAEIFSPQLKNYYKISGLFSCDAAGAITQNGATTEIAKIETTAGCSVSFNVVLANYLRIQVDSNSNDATWYVKWESVKTIL